MQKTDALIVDYGPTFNGTALKTDNGIVCVVPRQLQPHSEAGNVLRELVQGLGGTCEQCSACPLGGRH